MTINFDELTIVLEALEASVLLLYENLQDKELKKEMAYPNIGSLVYLANLSPIVPLSKKIGILETIEGKSDGCYYVIKCFDGTRMSWGNVKVLKIPQSLHNRWTFS
ncbi:hypothetical protein ABD91_21455 [Lysinibacillus sphaericus]|uniref:hypothetical protein n=1 Tax=Lysinibacillus sphaericus TaxID=1421 RepID=UPI0018CD7D66|nr:hypothetical protein [Lysinibacillus sphaericus]MBG9693305.1 hypothetical protein [Lysinibacillus sphaericus]